MKSKDRIRKIIKEELTKAEVSSMIQSRIDSNLTSKDFDKKVKEITSSVINELFKTLYQHNSIWQNSIKR